VFSVVSAYQPTTNNRLKELKMPALLISLGFFMIMFSAYVAATSVGVVIFFSAACAIWGLVCIFLGVTQLP
jgi:hypothetical protein